MHIVLDANAIVSEGFGNSRQFKALLSVSNALGHTIVVPQVVIDEVVSRFSKSMASEVEAVRSKLNKLSNWMDRSLESPVGSFNLECETKLFAGTLKSKLEDADVVVVGYPDTAHEVLVRRATSRTRPFNETGSGYRDTLIWMSVMDLVPCTTERIILVAADKAFAISKDDHHLHSELVAEVGQIEGGDADSVALCKDLVQLVDEHIRPSLNDVAWQNPLETLATLVADADETITLAIQEQYFYAEWDPHDLGLSWEFESPRLALAEGVTNLAVLDVREYPGNRYLVNIEANFDAQFDVFMYKSDWYMYEDEPNLFVEDWDWNDHGLMAGIILPMHCTADLVVSAPNGGQHEVQAVTVGILG